MAKFTHELTLSNDIDEVFWYVSNPVNNPVWDSSAVEAEHVNRKIIEKGTTGKGISTFLGETFETDFIYNQYEPPMSVSHRTRANVVDVAMSSDLEELEHGTKLKLDIDVKLNGKKKLLSPILKSKIKQRIEENLDTVKLHFRMMALKRR
jgi:hypothetical protein